MNVKKEQTTTLDKTILLGDTHGRGVWKDIIEKEKPTRVVFIGDYFDSYDFSGARQRMNFIEIIDFKEHNPEVEVIMLIGNHDHHYFPYIGDTGTSGYQKGSEAMLIGEILREQGHHLQMAYQLDDILCTHAGVTETWLEKAGYETGIIAEYINDVWKHKPMEFAFKSYDMRSDPTGNNIWQSPIWVRPRSLMADSQKFKKDFIQVVGHTGQSCIDIKGKSTGGRYFFIDTLGHSGEYLIYENKKFKVGKV